MGIIGRILFAVGIIVVDAVLFFLPLGALLLAYILIFNPPWFRNFLTEQDNK